MNLKLPIVLLLVPLVAQAQEPESYNIVVIGLVLIFVILSLLTLREYVRYRRAARLLNTIEGERSAERMRSKAFMDTTVEDMHTRDLLDRQKYLSSRSNDESTLDDLFQPNFYNEPQLTSTSEALPQHDYQNDEVINSLDRLFLPGFGQLAKPIEYYLQKSGMGHYLNENMSQNELINTIQKLRHHRIDNAVLNVAELAIVDTSEQGSTVFSVHDLLDDIVSAARLLYPKVDIELTGDTQSRISGNLTEIKKLTLAIILSAVQSHKEQNIDQPIIINIQNQGGLVRISIRDFSKGMTPQRLRDAIAGKTYGTTEQPLISSLSLLNNYLAQYGTSSVVLGTNPVKGTKITLILKSANI